MSYKDLYEWYEYHKAEPFMVDRIEIQLATISTLIAGFGGSKLKHNDFMISHKVKKEQTLKEFEDDIKAKFLVFAKKDK